MSTSTPGTITGILETMTIDDVRALNPEVVVLPIASTEPHGPHLPYGTDVFQCDAVCRRAVQRANERGGRVLMYPTLPISNNVNFKAFPFACRIGVRTLMRVLLDIIDALEADGIRKIVLVNGHGGNPDTIRATLREQLDRKPPGQGPFVCLVPGYLLPDGEAELGIAHESDHGGESETSQILHLRPDLVRQDKLDVFPIHDPAIAHLQTASAEFVRLWHAYMPVSVGGETRESTAAKGQRVIDTVADGLAALLVELTEAAWHERFPYKAE
ncbi:MAG: creatininase family protein [Phycisphaeraceae bacterium]